MYKYYLLYNKQYHNISGQDRTTGLLCTFISIIFELHIAGKENLTNNHADAPQCPQFITFVCYSTFLNIHNNYYIKNHHFLYIQT